MSLEMYRAQILEHYNGTARKPTVSPQFHDPPDPLPFKNKAYVTTT